ncbi:hypothetical protein P5673_014273 [Acropora cervicornis]|uniref:Uncharacterized protein n=1 Tax=Acropora cervicornis TaxID=6130 RepID=A0AAD9QJN5_ACRCE|nr:hypothetical protein P5673_014273 [Acropora cervicornis]
MLLKFRGKRKALTVEQQMFKLPEKNFNIMANCAGDPDNRAAYTPFKSVAFGENVAKSRAKKSLSKLVNVNAKRMKEALGKRSKIFTGEKELALH